MKRNFLLETILLSVVCVNVNNALCDCCSVGKEKKFIAKALGIKESDIWFIKKFKGKNANEEYEKFVDKQGEDFKNRVGNSHEVVLSVGNIDESGKLKKDDLCAFFAFIDKEKSINPSSELLDEVVDSEEEFYAKNKGKKVKIIIVNKHDGDGKVYFCKKS